MLQPLKTSRCPQCGEPARLDAANPWRPFCGERCKLLDLGAWTSERYTIAADDEIGGATPPDDDSQRSQ